MNHDHINSKKWATVFVLGLFFYALSGETLHFFNHFFPGVTFGVIILIILLLMKKSTLKYEFIIPFATYLYAIVPEFIAFARKLEGGQLFHADWEDIFLFHVTLDHWLEQTELVIPASAAVLYFSIIAYNKVRSKVIL